MERDRRGASKEQDGIKLVELTNRLIMRSTTGRVRLMILDSGHGIGKKALFAFIRAVSRQPVLDVIKLLSYRPGSKRGLLLPLEVSQ